MIQNAMSSNGAVGLFLPIGTTINGIRYRKILERQARNSHFMNAICSCKTVLLFFLKNNVKTLDCSANSPDLENLWAILKDKVANEHPAERPGNSNNMHTNAKDYS